MERMTETEHKAYRMELDQKRCLACAKSVPVVWGRSVCSIGLRWPKFGTCRGFTEK